MSFDVLMMMIVVGGIGLSAAYVGAEYIHWRERGAAERRRETALRELHAARLSEQQNAALLPSVLQLEGFSEEQAANPDGDATIGAGRRAARVNSLRTFPIGDRRKRDRQRVTH
jgi:hypothetical protein